MPQTERSWVRDAVQREAGVPAVSTTLLFSDDVVELGLAETSRGPFLAVRTPVGESVVALPERPPPALAPLPRAPEEPGLAAPPVMDIAALEGLAAFRPELAALGITTAAGLAAADPNVLAHAVGAPLAIVKRWQSAVELLALPGMEPRDAFLMASVGVDSLADLARRAPPALVRELNRRGETEGHDVVYEETVRTWVEEARRRTVRRTLPV